MEKVQIIKRKCCGTVFAACAEPYCYTDSDWLKSLKEYASKGCKVELTENSFKFEECTCKTQLMPNPNQMELFT